MEIPDVLKLAINRGMGRFLHDQVKLTMPPGAYAEFDLSPPTPDVTWVTFALTFGNIPEDSFDVWHYHRQMRRHRDPSWYSIGIGPSFVYPLWLYVTQAEPHTIEVTCTASEPATADVCWWMVEIPNRLMPDFRRMLNGWYNDLWAKGGLKPEDVETITTDLPKLRLYTELFPELREALRRKYYYEVERFALERGLRVELRRGKPEGGG